MVAEASRRKKVVAMSLQHSEWRLVDDGAILAQLTSRPILKYMVRKRYIWSEMVIRLISQ